MKRSRDLLQSDSKNECRDFTKLFIHTDTLNCALEGCVCCLHKIFFIDLPEGLPPNQRPEMCHRVRKKLLSIDTSSGLYEPGAYKALILGDGDFSFSNSLVKHFKKGSYYTSYESHSSVTTIYPSALDNIQQLSNIEGTTVLHHIDATNIKNSIINNSNHDHDKTQLDIQLNHYFDRIIWNFPCIAKEKGQDGQAEDLKANQDLITSFFISSKDVLSKDGEIHITHKVIQPFNWWDIETLGRYQGYKCIGRVIFDKLLYPAYTNRKVLDKRSFPCHDAETFIFVIDNDSNSRSNSNNNNSNSSNSSNKEETSGSVIMKQNKSFTSIYGIAKLRPLSQQLLHELKAVISNSDFHAISQSLSSKGINNNKNNNKNNNNDNATTTVHVLRKNLYNFSHIIDTQK